MAQYYWEADSGDVGSLPTNATVASLWHAWTSLEVTASSEHVDFPYALRGSFPDTDQRRIAAFSKIDGNALTQSGVTEIYAVYTISRTFNTCGIAGRISGDDSSETAVIYRNRRGGSDSQLLEYDNASYTELATPTFDGPAVVGLRMQFDGSTVKLRMWDYDTTEPGTWNATVTTGVTAGGDWGLHNFDNNFSGHVDLLAFGFGNDGDTAPTEPVSGGSSESVSHSANADAAFIATAAVQVSVNESASAGESTSAIAVVSAAIIEGIAAGDSSTDIASLLSSLTQGATANDTESAIAAAASAIIEGAVAGESWVARADALAQIIESAQGTDTISRVTADLETALISEGSTAAESFLSAVTSIGLLSEAASAAESFVAALSVISSVSEGATASAAFVPIYSQSGYLVADSITVVAALATQSIEVSPLMSGTISVTPSLSGTINVKPKK